MCWSACLTTWRIVLRSSVAPNSLSISALLVACARLSALDMTWSLSASQLWVLYGVTASPGVQ
jgi:hypothetical protein